MWKHFVQKEDSILPSLSAKANISWCPCLKRTKKWSSWSGNKTWKCWKISNKTMEMQAAEKCESLVCFRASALQTKIWVIVMLCDDTCYSFRIPEWAKGQDIMDDVWHIMICWGLFWFTIQQYQGRNSLVEYAELSEKTVSQARNILPHILCKTLCASCYKTQQGTSFSWIYKIIY